MTTVAAARRLGEAAALLFRLLPALAVAGLVIRGTELADTLPASSPVALGAQIVALGLGLDALALWRGLWLLFLLLLPALLIARRGATWAVLALVVLAATALSRYFVAARVPLGADLFAYSAVDVGTTLMASLRFSPALLAALVLPQLALAAMLVLTARLKLPSPRLAAGLLLASALSAPWLSPPGKLLGSEDLQQIALNKTDFFVADALSEWTHIGLAPRARWLGIEPVLNGERPVDPDFPFLHAERTPDVLSPLLAPATGTPPNLVIIIVEGLGRAFSGPGARLGSFTPFLDQLASTSLYWENFVAPQGRTFGVLPSILGSLPFGARGFNELMPLPAHDSLLSVLGAQGYHTQFMAGFNPAFDRQRQYLKRAGAAEIIGLNEFGSGYTIMPGASSWGYPDGELLRLAANRWPGHAARPFASLIQTVSMHAPFEVPDPAAAAARLDARLADLGLDAAVEDERRQFALIYASILYTDDALRRYFDTVRTLPGYDNTLFVITGDHRLPEIPMDSRLDRFHVPLLIHSPLLRGPARFKPISSHFDLAPSLLALLAQRDGLRTPARVTWLGCGLDTSRYFRGGCEIPLRQTKTMYRDFIAGDKYYDGAATHRLSEGLQADRIPDAPAATPAAKAFARFDTANRWFGDARALAPPSDPAQWLPYSAIPRRPPVMLVPGAAVAVHDVRAPAQARAGRLLIDVEFGNDGDAPSDPFVPLVVVLDSDGREREETYGAAIRLEPGAIANVALDVRSSSLPPGRYALTVIPSHPDTGKPVGPGRHRIEVELQP